MIEGVGGGLGFEEHLGWVGCEKLIIEARGCADDETI